MRLWLLSAYAAAGLAAPQLPDQRPLRPAPAAAAAASNACKLRATRRDLSEGFPAPGAGRTLAPTTGVLRAAMFFVDFPDAPANDTAASLRAALLPGAADWFAASSYGRLRLDVQVAG